VVAAALSAALRPAIVLYLIACLAALAAGLWPQAIRGEAYEARGAPVPALRALAVGQVGFLLLVYPLVFLARQKGVRNLFGAEKRFLTPFSLTPFSSIEWAAFLAATTPAYYAAAFFQDATATDVVRTAIYVTCLLPVSWSAGTWLSWRRCRPVVVAAMAVIALGLPAAYYIARDFLAVSPAGATWLWHLSPATFAWTTAGPRQAAWLPKPVWALLVWPLAAAAVALARGLFGGRRTRPPGA
jgi:hypothetical protein